jgi:hypothetical protein
MEKEGQFKPTLSWIEIQFISEILVEASSSLQWQRVRQVFSVHILSLCPFCSLTMSSLDKVFNEFGTQFLVHGCSILVLGRIICERQLQPQNKCVEMGLRHTKAPRRHNLCLYSIKSDEVEFLHHKNCQRYCRICG